MSVLFRSLRTSVAVVITTCALGPASPGAADGGIAEAAPAVERAGAAEPLETGEDRESLRLLSRAEGLLRQGQALAAAALAQGLPAAGPHATAGQRLRCWALLTAGSHAGVLAALDDHDLLDGELLFLRGAARWRARLEGGLEDLRQLWWGEPDGIWGLAALQELTTRAAGSPYSSRERALVGRHVPPADLDTALSAEGSTAGLLAALLDAAGQRGLLAAELQHARGVRLLRAEEFTQAVAALRRAVALSGERALGRVIELRLGEAERRRGGYAAARGHFRRVAAGSQDAFGQEALALAGQMAIEYRRYDEARELFEAQLLASPVGPGRHQALWGLGWVAFRTGDFRGARRFFAALHAEAPYGRLAPAALYWGARAAEELRLEGASREMAAVESLFPVDYYAHRAARWRRDRERPEPAALPSRRDPRVEHLLGLVDAGMHRRASEPLRRLRQRAGELSPEELDGLARAARTLSLPAVAESFARARHRRFPEGGAAAQLLAASFPAGYVNRLQAEARKQRIEAELPVAVALQESGFNPRAASAVGALGLMQLMPLTGAALLREEQRRGSSDTATLLDPAVNIRLGVRYLGRMLRAFDRRVEYALAAYNAGPGAVTRWREARGDLPVDIFVEEIPYAETRVYVKRVLAGLQLFRWVQAAGSTSSPLASAGASH